MTLTVFDERENVYSWQLQVAGQDVAVDEFDRVVLYFGDTLVDSAVSDELSIDSEGVIRAKLGKIGMSLGRHIVKVTVYKVGGGTGYAADELSVRVVQWPAAA